MNPTQETTKPIDYKYGEYFFLEAIQNPAIIIDIENKHILGVNQRFAQLTSYTNGELLTQNPYEIITVFLMPTNNGDDFIGGTSRVCSVIDKQGVKHATKLTQLPFDKNKSRLLYIFQPLLNEHKHYTLDEDLQAVSDLLFLMINRSSNPDTLTIIKSIKSITHSTFVAYYKKGKNSDFNHVNSHGTVKHLPVKLHDPANLLLVPRVWEKTQTIDIPSLEQVKNEESLQYLITYPIIIDGVHTGNLVLGNSSTTIKKNVLKVLQAVVSIFAHNINEEKEKAQPLQKYPSGFDEEKSSISEVIEDGIIILSPELKIRDMNPSAQRFLGYSLDEAIGKPYDFILTNIDLLINALQLAKQGVATHDMPSVTLHRRNGEIFSAQVKVYPVLQSKSVYSILIVIRDISEYDKIVEHAKQLEQRAWLGNLTAIFAHEVRNPINNIKTGLQLMAENIPEDSEDQKTIERLLNDCNRLNNLMEATLNYSRFGTYKFEFIDIQAMLEKIINHWQIKFIRSNVVSNIKTTTEKTTVFGDKRALDQVFQNIISNALHIMKKQGGGVLSVQIQSEEKLHGKDMIRIDISDTGPGIPENVMEHIFDPFFTTNPEGTGLGLAISKQIITAHKGSIEVESFPGGTVFRISLPYRSDKDVSNGVSH